jgi:hypothetical protein
MAKYLVTKTLHRSNGDVWTAGDTIDTDPATAERYADRLEPVALSAPARKGKDATPEGDA